MNKIQCFVQMHKNTTIIAVEHCGTDTALYHGYCCTVLHCTVLCVDVVDTVVLVLHCMVDAVVLVLHCTVDATVSEGLLIKTSQMLQPLKHACLCILVYSCTCV